ncbi:unnamed protein product [Lactuca saligna]|uniref:Uncharacterized protein n=1 Tax=Lactuca saligna TaxID=75948 RepID=A0AA35Z8K7_LACSI|nr:unnamed protein product [Lactuca saligna]
MGLTYLMLNQSKKDVEYLENTLSTYLLHLLMLFKVILHFWSLSVADFFSFGPSLRPRNVTRQKFIKQLNNMDSYSGSCPFLYRIWYAFLGRVDVSMKHNICWKVWLVEEVDECTLIEITEEMMFCCYNMIYNWDNMLNLFIPLILFPTWNT